METSQQKSMQDAELEHLNENFEASSLSRPQIEPRVMQLTLPKEALDEMAEAERKYREIVERENR